jgi:AcrR family transcriptional regulator
VEVVVDSWPVGPTGAVGREDAEVPSTLLREPKQERSRRTAERVLDALEELLREKSFEAITVRELLARSRTSAGSVYARFPAKDALLPVLYDRHDARVHAGVDAWMRDPARERVGSLEARVAELAAQVVKDHRERRWFKRAVALHARTHPEMIPPDQRRRRERVHRAWQDELLRFRDRIGHPDPERAVAFGLFMLVSTCREKVVFGDAPLATSFKLTDAQLADELARALLAYLDVPSKGVGR